MFFPVKKTTFNFPLFFCQDVTSMEEKTEYRLDERTSDINDMLENCLTRVGIVDQLKSRPASSISDVFSFITYTYLHSICNTIIRYYHLIFSLLR